MLLKQLTLLLLLAGCDRRTPEEKAEDAVRDFWSAVEADDCARLVTMVAKPMTPEDCAEWMAELEQNGLRFVDVESVKPDGRDPDAMIAKIRVSDGGRERVVLMRVEPGEHGLEVSL